MAFLKLRFFRKFFLLLLLLSEPNPLCFSAQSGMNPDPGGFHWVPVTESSWIPFMQIGILLIYLSLWVLMLLPVVFFRLEPYKYLFKASHRIFCRKSRKRRADYNVTLCKKVCY